MRAYPELNLPGRQGFARSAELPHDGQLEDDDRGRGRTAAHTSWWPRSSRQLDGEDTEVAEGLALAVAVAQLPGYHQVTLGAGLGAVSVAGGLVGKPQVGEDLLQVGPGDAGLCKERGLGEESIYSGQGARPRGASLLAVTVEAGAARGRVFIAAAVQSLGGVGDADAVGGVTAAGLIPRGRVSGYGSQRE